MGTPKHGAASLKKPPVKAIVLGVAALLAAAAVVGTFFISVLEMRGDSMEPSYKSGSYAFVLHGNAFAQDDAAAFSLDNKLLVRRVVGLPGDQIEVRDDGAVAVNGVYLDRDYATTVKTNSVTSTAAGDQEYPFTVPDDSYFILCDDRSDMADSRMASFGTLSKDDALGKVMFSF